MKMQNIIIIVLGFFIIYLFIFSKNKPLKQDEVLINNTEEELKKMKKDHDIIINIANNKIDSIQKIELKQKNIIYVQSRKNKKLQKRMAIPVNYNKQYLDSFAREFRHEVRQYEDILLQPE